MQQNQHFSSLIKRTDGDKFMSSEIIRDLVRKAQKGDADSFGELYEMYEADMYRFAYYYTGSKASAEDCVSEAVLLAFRKIGELRNISSFKSWLFRILRNCCAAYFRNGARENSSDEIYEGVHSFENESNDKLSLRGALMKLPAEDREIIILHYCNGYTSREISLMLTINENTVRSRISRGTEKLRNELKDGE